MHTCVIVGMLYNQAMMLCGEKYAIKDPNDKVRGPKQQILHSRVHAQIASRTRLQ